MNTKKAFVFILLIFLMPIIPMVISKGWETKLDPPQNSRIPDMEDVSPYDNVTVKVLHEGNVINIPLFEYLCGVVSSEMPATYETEALKAQAVAACSYSVYKTEAQKNSPGLFPEHNGAYLCTDSTHCKAYADAEKRKEMWGDNYETYNAKTEGAVSQVLGYILTYEGEPANAVFHAISFGKTESAQNVWGSPVPYLVSVDSAFDECAENFQTEVFVEKQAFLEALSPYLENATENITIGEAVRSDAGTVKSISLCNKEFTGAQIREIFSLRSSNFTLTETEAHIVFTVKGYGHGVGMSQFGANEMAKNGADYTEILSAYYCGTKLEKYAFS